LDAGSCHEELKHHHLLDSHGKLVPLPPVLDALPRCAKCGLLKPDRAHHCSTCGRCYFRFDHHCPVVGNCIALNNMKAFMLFLIYTGVMLIIAGLTAICTVTVSFQWVKLMLALAGGMAIVAAIAIAGFGCSYIPQVCVNRTTLERIAGVPEGTFDSGHSENFRQIFGKSGFAWFFPTAPSISGFAWSGIEDLDHIQMDRLPAPLTGNPQLQAAATHPPETVPQASHPIPPQTDREP
jgi:palmitoyltransferase